MIDSVRRTILTTGAAAAATTAAPQVFAQAPQAAAAPGLPAGAKVGFYQKGNVRIRYAETGSGFPLLATPGGPWVVTETDNDSTSPRDLRSFMLNTRYWWLEGAPTDSIRRGIDAVFDKYDVETIAPGYGCILRGRNVVKRHYQMLDEFLKASDKSRMVSRYVTRDEER